MNDSTIYVVRMSFINTSFNEWRPHRTLIITHVLLCGSHFSNENKRLNGLIMFWDRIFSHTNLISDQKCFFIRIFWWTLVTIRSSHTHLLLTYWVRFIGLHIRICMCMKGDMIGRLTWYKLRIKSGRYHFSHCYSWWMQYFIWNLYKKEFFDFHKLKNRVCTVV